MKSRFDLAKDEIVSFFQHSEGKLYRSGDLYRIFESNRSSWNMAVRSSGSDFIAFLMLHGLQRFAVKFAGQGEASCYSWGDTSIWTRLQFVKPTSYYSHQTALQLLGLADQSSRTLYLTQPHGSQADLGFRTLTQGSIDAAFHKPQRVTSKTATVEGYEVRLTTGGSRTDLIKLQLKDGTEAVELTSLERTLIDAVIRPAYAGGVAAVLNAFTKAKTIETLSISRLLSVLSNLELLYPYHQAIGFYLQRAGYPASDVDLFRQIPRKFDFYLTHDMARYQLVPEWRIYVPTGL